MDPMAEKVALRFRDQRGPSKQTRVKDLTKRINEATGVSRGVAGQIADAHIRGRDVGRLTHSKNWPISDGVIEGPDGDLKLSEL